MEIRVEKITPERAKELLATTRNRKVKPGHVARLARDMTSGNWRSNSVAHVATTPDGEVMIDGQHRMMAVIASDTTVEMIVIYGESLHDQEVLDTGKARTLADTLTLRGEVNCNGLAAAIGWYWRRERGYYVSYPTLSIAEGLQVLSEHPALRQSLQPVRAVSRQMKVPAGLAACLHYEMTRIDPDSAADFWDKIDRGLDLHEHHPIYLLRGRLIANATATQAKVDTPVVQALIIKAWNAYIRGDDVRTLKWSRGGAHPEAFPELEMPEE